jgi:hypothetical protein
VTGFVPLVVLIIAEPLVRPKQLTLMDETFVTTGPGAFEMLAVVVAEQPLASVTMILYVPDVIPDMAPLD